MGSIVLTLFFLSVHVFILWLMFACCFSVQLLGGCSDESWSQWPFDERPHVCRAVPGQAQAVCFPAAGPPQPAQQESATPLDDAARACQPLVLYSKCGRRRGTNLEPFFLLGMFYRTEIRTSSVLFEFLKLVDKMCCREVEDKIFWINSIQLYLRVSFVPISPFLCVHQCSRK